MSLSSPSPPTPQNPKDVAATQQQYNMDTAAAQQAGSNVNQVTPFGSLTYQQTGTGPGGIPLYTATSSLSPQIKSIYDSLMGQAGTTLGNANYGSTDPAATVGNMTSGTTKDLLDTEVSYLNPYFKTQTDQLDTKLRNQGLLPGSPAYDTAMRATQNNQGNTVTGFLAQAEPAAYQQAMQSYMLPLGVTSAELGLLNPGEVTGSLVNPPQTKVNPADYTGAVNSYNQAQQGAYQAQVQAQSGLMSGLFGIPSAILGGWARSPSGGSALTSLMGF
jgi:hypothetical protein